MVPRTNNEYLGKAGLQNRAQRVFIQRWLELLHPLTIGTYAVKLLNTRGALNELIDVGKLVADKRLQFSHLPETKRATPIG